MLMGSYIGILAVTNMLLAAGAAEVRDAQRAIAQSERRFRAIVEDQADLICRFDPDGALTFVNDAYCHFHGKTREELLGTNFLTGLHLGDTTIPLAFFGELPKEKPVISFDHRILSADGHELWQQYTIRRLFMETGDTFEFQAVIHDITYRKQAEHALQNSERNCGRLWPTFPVRFGPPAVEAT